MSNATLERQTPMGNVVPSKTERTNVRWLMVVYDTVLYAICAWIIFVLHPSMESMPPISTIAVYVLSGYVLIFGFRFLLKCYKHIWRYGTVKSFTSEALAGILGGGLLILLGVLLNKVFAVAMISFVTLVSFVALYVLASLVIRLFYCQLYHFAKKENPVARIVRHMLERVAFVDFSSHDPGATLHWVLEPERRGTGPINELQNIVDQFAIRGTVTSIDQINKGYINRTYRVDTVSDRGHIHEYVLQRINTKVFPDVDALMDNFKVTTNHLFGKMHMPGRHKRGTVPTLRPTKDGCAYFRDDSGCWRMLTFFDNVFSLDIPDCPETFHQAGIAFGTFLKEMSDVDLDDIHVVIPNFHNTASRYRDLEEAIARDPKGRVKDVAREIAFVRERADKYGMISDALESGEIPLRICHNDTNMNNILFDSKTHLPVAIIDLDTVMPSSPLYDFGDSMRIGTNTATDDEKDLSKVSCDLNLYENYARGYLAACGDVLTQRELELLPYAALIITSEDGIRFLMDHINGDTYYNIYYPGQNLDRARTQLKLLEDMERKLPQIKQILRDIYKDLGLQAQID